jgi:hypothetical protein
MHEAVRERFMAKVHKTNSCWLWIASIRPDGYGSYSAYGASRLAHRVSYEIHVGPIPEGLTLDHLCRNRACVNPDHLDPCSLEENVKRSPIFHSNRTHCPQGHPYDEANTIRRRRDGGWRRDCRACNRERDRIRDLDPVRQEQKRRDARRSGAVRRARRRAERLKEIG